MAWLLDFGNKFTSVLFQGIYKRKY